MVTYAEIDCMTGRVSEFVTITLVSGSAAPWLPNGSIVGISLIRETGGSGSAGEANAGSGELWGVAITSTGAGPYGEGSNDISIVVFIRSIKKIIPNASLVVSSSM